MTDQPEVSITEDHKTVSLLDGLQNITTGLGADKDKAFHNQWVHSGRNYDHVTLAARYREDWLAQKVVQILPQDMTRKWREFDSEDAKDADAQMRIRDIFREAYKWARLYGTSFIILDVNDGTALEKPLNWKKLGPGCIKNFNVVDRTRITVVGDIVQEPMAPDFGLPKSYQFVNSPTPIHKSRIIRFEGTELPIYERQRNLWYSDSILIPLMNIIDNFHTTSAAAAQMVQEANTDVISVEGLGNILQNSAGTNAMLQRFLDWKQIKSVFGVSILDSAEEYEQKKINLSGVDDLLWSYLKVVAASVGIPATRFLSASPDGMNATGYSDLTNYIELLQGMQEAIFTPRLDIVDRLLAIHYGLSEEAFEYRFCDIFPESLEQQEARYGTSVEYLARLTEAGIMSRDSALQEAKDKGIISKSAKVGTDPNSEQSSVSKTKDSTSATKQVTAAKTKASGTPNKPKTK